MITTENGYVEMQGDIIELLIDFTSIIESMHKFMSSNFDEDFANEIITLAGQLAYMTEEERKEKIKNIRGGINHA